MKPILSPVCLLLLYCATAIAQSQKVETIWFKKNSNNIEPEYLRLLDNIGKECIADGSPFLKIFAYADTTGSQQYNSKLFEARGMAVLNYLVRTYHIDSNHVYLTWLGEGVDQGYDLHFPDAHLQQRCVDVIAYFPNSKKRKKAAIDKAVHQFTRSKFVEKKFVIPNDSTSNGIHYNYVTGKDSCIKIARKFSWKDEATEQTFFLKNNKLFYATESITNYFTNGTVTDSMRWSGSFYFDSNKLIDYTTLGHGKSETEEWDPEKEMLSLFREAMGDTERYQ